MAVGFKRKKTGCLWRVSENKKLSVKRGIVAGHHMKSSLRKLTLRRFPENKKLSRLIPMRACDAMRLILNDNLSKNVRLHFTGFGSLSIKEGVSAGEGIL